MSEKQPGRDTMGWCCLFCRTKRTAPLNYKNNPEKKMAKKVVCNTKRTAF